MKLAHPKNLVVAEYVTQGKPGKRWADVGQKPLQVLIVLVDPECYLLGKERSGARGTGRFLVIEDSPAGVRAGKAAGCAVLGLATTHSIEQIKGAGADWIVKDLRSASLLGYDGQIGQVNIQISNALES